jgi:endonuclease/exonuclease/phosphatase family metal-dependent hydrolase
MKKVGRLAMVAAVAVATGCAHRPSMAVRMLPATSCGQVVSNRARQVTWVAPADSRDEENLGNWCRTVGPVVVESPPEAGADAPAIVDRLALVSWNVHVGGGDIEGFAESLRQGAFTAGVAMPHFVLLLQEAYRGGSDVPDAIPEGSPVPRSIIRSPPSGIRRDIRSVASRLGLHVVYAPAMRNNTGASREDRGTAILSTIQLADLQVIELPFERQRRVAVAATLAGATSSELPWRLRVAAVHMDTSLAFTRGGPFAARKRQAEALVEALAAGAATADAPMVVAGDFNTWLGPKEPAITVLRNAFPETPPPGNAATWRGPLGARAQVDYVFLRGPFNGASTRRLPHRYGSDHYPLLTILAF